MSQTRLLLLALSWLFISHQADAWSSTASKTHYKIKSAERMVEEYRQNTGKLPDSGNPWSTLRQDPQSILHDLPDLTIDSWKRELVYQAPGRHGDFDIYSVGPDGIDDHGQKDDVSSWAGVNDGYHWKEFWPLGRGILIAASVLSFLIFLYRRKIPRALGGPLAGLALSLGVALGSYYLRHPGRVPSRNLPLSIVLAAAGVFALGFAGRAWRNPQFLTGENRRTESMARFISVASMMTGQTLCHPECVPTVSVGSETNPAETVGTHVG